MESIFLHIKAGVNAALPYAMMLAPQIFPKSKCKFQVVYLDQNSSIKVFKFDSAEEIPSKSGKKNRHEIFFQ